jgi:hypothetical protein
MAVIGVAFPVQLLAGAGDQRRDPVGTAPVEVEGKADEPFHVPGVIGTDFVNVHHQDDSNGG